MATYTVLWFDQRDGIGILTDAAGNEFYTDSSVVDFPEFMFSGVEVSGSRLYELGETICVKKVFVNLGSAYDSQLKVLKSLKTCDPATLVDGAVKNQAKLLNRIGGIIRGCEHDDRENGHCIDCGHVKHGE